MAVVLAARRGRVKALCAGWCTVATIVLELAGYIGFNVFQQTGIRFITGQAHRIMR